MGLNTWWTLAAQCGASRAREESSCFSVRLKKNESVDRSVHSKSLATVWETNYSGEGMTTWEHLIEVGLRLMQEKGYQATGLKEILDEAGVPKGSFYHHFSSKEGFAQEVLKRYALGEVARCKRVLSTSAGSPLTRLRRYFRELVKVFGPAGTINGCLVGRMSLDSAAESVLLRAQLSQAF